MNIIRTLIAATLLAAPAAHAEGLVVGAHIGSWHSEPGYNNTNLGAYVRTEGGWTLGAYRNSVRRTSVYAGRTFSYALGDDAEASVTVAAITGYRLAPVLPLLAPSVRIGPVRLAFLPKTQATGAHVVHAMIEFNLE